jgi:hypothetical protein
MDCLEHAMAARVDQFALRASMDAQSMRTSPLRLLKRALRQAACSTMETRRLLNGEESDGLLEARVVIGA